MPPTLSTRGTPAGIKMDNGHSTKLSCARSQTLSFWEVTVKPPSMIGGDPIPTTTMHNVTYRSKAPQALIDSGNCVVTAAYDPNVYDQLLQYLNVEDSWTIRFPDGSTYTFFGWLREFEPDPLEEGTRPTATITIEVSNQNPTSGAEDGPVLVNVSGT